MSPSIEFVSVMDNSNLILGNIDFAFLIEFIKDLMFSKCILFYQNQIISSYFDP